MENPENDTVFTTDRCTVRHWREADLSPMVTLANNRNIWLGMRDHFPNPYTEEAGRAWLSKTISEQKGEVFAIEFEGQMIGAAGLHPQSDPNTHGVEMGYWIGEPFWGRGLATEVVVGLTRYGQDVLGYDRIYASVYSHNPASARVLEKAGYDSEGTLKRGGFKDGKVVDMWLFAKIKEA